MKVLIIGAARQGTALARFLTQRGARIALNDRRPVEDLAPARETLADVEGIEWVCGGHPLELLDGADLVCPSGGVPLTLPLIQEAQARGIPLSNDSQIFLELAPCRVIGITGSAGKTTTTALVGKMAQSAVEMNDDRHKLNAKVYSESVLFPTRVYVGGNIGNPLISFIGEIKSDDLVIMELSSFQLEIMSRSPQIAAVLNLTPNHLDRHGTMEAYTAAKARILGHQAEQDVAVLGRDDPGAWDLRKVARGGVVSFGLQPMVSGEVGSFLRDDELYYSDGKTEARLMPRSSVHLRGEHNLLNVLAACAMGAVVGLPVEAMRSGVESFQGVPHRLEFVRSWGGAAWYNDSIATAPERSIAAIHSFCEPIVLLAGGRDKNLPWEAFADLVRQRVDHLILFGEAADLVSQVVGPLQADRRPYTLVRFASLQEAVQSAAQVVEPGDVVLLAPGGTSFDEFRDFEERGEAFKRWVSGL